MGFEVIKELARDKGIRLESIASEAGISYNSLSKIIRGVSKEPQLKTVKGIARALGMTLDEISYALDPTSTPPGERKSPYDITSAEIDHIKKYRTLDPYSQETVSMVLDREVERNALTQEEKTESNFIPMRTISYYQRVSAGTGKLIYGDVVADPIEIPEIPEYRYVNYAVGIDGDSMEPEYFDGEVLLVEQTDAVEIGEIGIFLVDDDAYIKELGRNELISLNKRHPNIPLDEHSRCMGRVIGTLE